VCQWIWFTFGAAIAGGWNLVFPLPTTIAHLWSASLERLFRWDIATERQGPGVKCESQHSNLKIHVRLQFWVTNPHSKGRKEDEEESHGDGAKDVRVAAFLGQPESDRDADPAY